MGAVNVESEVQSWWGVLDIAIGGAMILSGVGSEAHMGDGRGAFVFFGRVGEGHVFFDSCYVFLRSVSDTAK